VICQRGVLSSLILRVVRAKTNFLNEELNVTTLADPAVGESPRHPIQTRTMSFLGIDIGGTSVKLAAIQDGKTLWTSQSAHRRNILSSPTQHAAQAARPSAGLHAQTMMLPPA
jgi:activator of 2-hydroxyglutaryl-CoA dehydratase